MRCRANAVGVAIGAAAVGEPGAVAVRKVSEVSPADLAGLQLLVVGAPTRAFRPSPGVAQWLRDLPAGAPGDTRISPQDANSAVLRFMVKLFGWAAEKIAKGLAARGGHEAAPAMGFFVAASEGPLKEGELDRAAAWARQVVAGA